MRKMFVDDAQHMEEICERTVDRCDIWQDRSIYWIAVTLLHVVQWILRHYKD